jgi:hypothetical protein
MQEVLHFGAQIMRHPSNLNNLCERFLGSFRGQAAQIPAQHLQVLCLHQRPFGNIQEAEIVLPSLAFRSFGDICRDLNSSPPKL